MMGVKAGQKNPNYPKTRKGRYYKTPYNEFLKIKNNFKAQETQEFIDTIYKMCEEYSHTHSESQRNGYRRVIGMFTLSLDMAFDMETIDKTFFANLYSDNIETTMYIVPVLKDIVYIYLQMNQKYKWNTELYELSEKILPLYPKVENFKQHVLPFLTGEKDFCKSRLIYINSITTKKPAVTCIDFDTDNLFIQDLLIEYQYKQWGEIPRVYNQLFFKHFAESLDYKLPKDIYGFNTETLLKQEKFFASFEYREPELENRYFYRFIINKQGEKKQISPSTGVSITYLLSESFSKMFPAGFKFIPFNPNEGCPTLDKWAISPNGLEEKTSSDKPSMIRYIDYTRIPDKTIRNAVKNWFWSEAKAGFENRCRNVLYIIEFFEYREKFRATHYNELKNAHDEYSGDIDDLILSEEIIFYTNEWNNKITEQSYKSRIVPLKKFLRYMNEKNIFKTEEAAFEYLLCSNKGLKPKQEILPVPKDDFKKLIKILESKAQGNNLHMLYYVVFCLNTLTPLRISSILDLDYDCMVEKSKGIYAITTKVKTSDGDLKHIQISNEVKRLIEVAISTTSKTREEAPDRFKHFLFLVNTQKDFYKSIPHRSYNKYLQTCCHEIGIEPISAQNLRKTYYTNLIENAVKNNVSLMSLKELTGHSNIDTTENYYVKENIRNYLEATFGVEIGNMPIVGEVVTSYDDAKQEDLVNNECGYCRNPECNVLGTANCLMCKGFITTPEHIDQFIEGINVIDSQIINNENPHDKEHLYAVKRLYTAYLEQLYIRKEEQENATNNQ